MQSRSSKKYKKYTLSLKLWIQFKVAIGPICFPSLCKSITIQSETQTPSSNRMMKKYHLHIPFMGFLILLLSLVPILLQQIGMPNGMQDTFGWTVLQQITQKPHPYNSNENKLVRNYLVDVLVQIKNDYDDWKCSRPNPIQIEANDTLLVRFGHIYIESDNIVVWFRGEEQDALLVSSHFDSAPGSHGATDAGVGIASMVATVKRLAEFACRETVPYSVVFNFNNGEEDGLLGARAFTQHPRFNEIKAFINLEGTGASYNFKSALFRTNSFPLVSKALTSSKFPHASVTANNAMRILQSDTDYTPYSTAGKLPGVDYAFYSFRYLYHTVRDDISHTSEKSLEFSIQNLYSTIMGIILDQEFLKTVRIDDNLVSSVETLVPKFSFYDYFGLFPVIKSQGEFTISQEIVRFLSILFLVYVVWRKYRDCTGLLFGKHVLCIITSSLFTIGIFFAAVLVFVFFAYVRTMANPGLTYGCFELVLVSIPLLALSLICILQSFRLRDSKTISMPRFSFTSQQQSISSSVTNLTSETQDSLSKDRYIEAHELKMTGILVFWILQISLSLILSYTFGVSIINFGFDFGLCYLISLIIIEIQQSIYFRFKSLKMETKTKTAQIFIKFHENYSWILQLLVSIAIPFVFFVDSTRFLFLALPSLTGEGIPDYAMDGLFSYILILPLINFLPLLSRTNLRIASFVFFVLFLCSYVPQFFLFPYSIDRPFKYSLQEIWDISNAQLEIQSTVKLFVMTGMGSSKLISLLNKNNISLSVDLSTTIPRKTSEIPVIDVESSLIVNQTSKYIYAGKITGPFDSRVCSITYSFGNITLETSKTWRKYPDASIKNLQTNGAKIFKREAVDNRIQFEFQVESHVQNPNVTIACYRQFSANDYYHSVLQQKQPQWFVHTTFFQGAGQLKIQKSILLS